MITGFFWFAEREILQELQQLVLDNMRARFKNVGVAKYMPVLRPDYQDLPALPLAKALKAFSGHFSFNLGELEAEWKHVTRLRNRALQVQPERRTLLPHVFWPPLLQRLEAPV